MARRKSITEIEHRQRTLEGPEDAELRGRIRDADDDREFRTRVWRLVKLIAGYAAGAASAFVVIQQIIEGLAEKGSP